MRDHALGNCLGLGGPPGAELLVHAAQRGLRTALLSDLGRDIRALQLIFNAEVELAQQGLTLALEDAANTDGREHLQEGEAADASTTQPHLRQGVGLFEGSEVLVVETNPIVDDIEAVHDHRSVSTLVSQVIGRDQPDADGVVDEAVLMLFDGINRVGDGLVQRHHGLGLGKLQPVYQTLDVGLHY